MTVEQFLRGSPYLVAEDQEAGRRLERAIRRAGETRDRATQARERIASEASALLEPYLRAIRTELVAESNAIEGLDWSAHGVREVLYANRELLDAPVGTFVEAVRRDQRVYEALGLYRAHLIAEEWAESVRPPRAYEIRELHRFILGAVPASGQYKRFSNAIGGSQHRTTEPIDVNHAMLELSDWWDSAAAHPVLTASVVHAWLVHVHPFEDGNGRLARILANLELARNGYPPLVIRAGSDRGEYYQALAASDEGDILPLFELFEKLIRRQVKIMSRPGYVVSVIEDRLLSDDDQRREYWLGTLRVFGEELRTALSDLGLRVELQGVPSPEAFALLCALDKEGNGWYLKVIDQQGRPEWLLWFGYRSAIMRDLSGARPVFPSIFVSRRDLSPEAIHPYTPHFRREAVPDEISVVPGMHEPIGMRWGYGDVWKAPTAAARELALAIAAESEMPPVEGRGWQV
jgi:Fic family protein